MTRKEGKELILKIHPDIKSVDLVDGEYMNIGGEYGNYDIAYVDNKCKDDEWKNFQFKCMPGQCSTAIISNFDITETGIEIAKLIAKEFKFGLLLATVAADSFLEVFEKSGFKEIYKLTNPKTNNEVKFLAYGL